MISTLTLVHSWLPCCSVRSRGACVFCWRRSCSEVYKALICRHCLRMCRSWKSKLSHYWYYWGYQRWSSSRWKARWSPMSQLAVLSGSTSFANSHKIGSLARKQAGCWNWWSNCYLHVISCKVMLESSLVIFGHENKFDDFQGSWACSPIQKWSYQGRESASSQLPISPT